LHGLNHLGPEGYHWRVCVEDKPIPGDSGSSEKSQFSWWDIQDENAVLPMKTATQSQLSKFFRKAKGGHAGGSELGDGVDAAAKAAKGAFKSFGKAVTSAVAGTDAASDSGPPVTVIAFKLLDLVKMHDDFSHKNHGRGGHIPQPSVAAAPAPRPAPRQQHRPAPSAHTTARSPAHAAPHQQQRRSPQAPVPARKPSSQEASLMDFGDSGSATTSASHSMHHSASSPASFGSQQRQQAVNPNETRAEKLKREYAQKKQHSNRVWDDIDQRWVEVDPKAVSTTRATKSAPPGADAVDPNKKKAIGISLDPSNAAGKSATVQHAVNKRVNEMKQSQAKAVEEIRLREAKKKSDEAEEDTVRRRLEPKIKAWSEEHGQKKQLRALLATLHTILWPGANWKQVSIGDLLDDSKLKRCFHKASRVVHPDKTHHLNPEQRFLAKRIFDALSQAKRAYDDGAK